MTFSIKDNNLFIASQDDALDLLHRFREVEREHERFIDEVASYYADRCKWLKSLYDSYDAKPFFVKWFVSSPELPPIDLIYSPDLLDIRIARFVEVSDFIESVKRMLRQGEFENGSYVLTMSQDVAEYLVDTCVDGKSLDEVSLTTWC